MPTLEKNLLQICLQQAIDKSFNRITVDGDTSTNDACVLMATGKVDMPQLIAGSADAMVFSQLITEACQTLAQLIIRDAEGATKFVTVAVNGGRDSAECLQVAYTVAHSPLVKTALFASDPNWGRILGGCRAFRVKQICRSINWNFTSMTYVSSVMELSQMTTQNNVVRRSWINPKLLFE